MSITQLADECIVADATVSRFCRRLHLKGFSILKLELARLTASNSPRSSDSDLRTIHGRCQEVGRLSADAVQQTVSLTDPSLIEAAAALIESADRIMCVGSGSSMIIASECAYLFSNVTNKFISIADQHTQIATVASMKPQDVIILFSYSGATTGGLQLLELAKRKKIKSILITRFSKSPAAKLADVVLPCGSDEGPYQHGSVPAKVAQLTVCDMLYQEYCYRNQEICEENIHNIASALAELHI